MGIFAMGAFFLMAAIIYNLFQFAKGSNSGTERGKIGILLFVFLIGMENVIESYERINDGKQAVMYRQMAFTDLMTGLFKMEPFKIGVAIGYATYERADDNFEETRNRADMMLYENKQKIKDQG